MRKQWGDLFMIHANHVHLALYDICNQAFRLQMCFQVNDKSNRVIHTILFYCQIIFYYLLNFNSGLSQAFMWTKSSSS